MQIKIDDKVVFTIEEWHKKVLEDEMDPSKVDQDIERRLVWFLNHIFENKVAIKSPEWKEVLIQDGETSLPLNTKSFVEKVTKSAHYVPARLKVDEQPKF